MKDSHGRSSFEDIRMAGVAAGFYHYASYTIPGLLCSATGTPAFIAYANFLVPSGIFLTGLAAFSLVRSWWGPVAGLGATAALLLAPDGSSQLIINPWLGYHWLQMIGPGGTYGVAIMAVSWLLMIRGCVSGRMSLVALSFLFAGASIHYKAHIFIANALLLWLFPAFFAMGLPWWSRAAWLAIASTSFAGAIWTMQDIPGIPTILPDGSSFRAYLNRVVIHCQLHKTRDYFGGFASPGPSTPRDIFRGATLLFLGTFGYYGLGCLGFVVLMAVRKVFTNRLAEAGPGVRAARGDGADSSDRRRFEVATLVFPLLVIANYLAMSMGLAYNRQNAEHAEELLHRPLVWAYFAVSSWVGGAAVSLLSRGRSALSKGWRTLWSVLLILLLLIPGDYGHGVQRGPQWGSQFVDLQISKGLFDCADYVRTQGEPGDVLQEYGNDPRFYLRSWSERRAYAIAYFDGAPNAILSRRIEELDAFHRLTDEDSIRKFAVEHNIRWYLLPRSARVRWPSAFVFDPIFSSDHYRLYKFW